MPPSVFFRASAHFITVSVFFFLSTFSMKAETSKVRFGLLRELYENTTLMYGTSQMVHLSVDEPALTFDILCNAAECHFLKASKELT